MRVSNTFNTLTPFPTPRRGSSVLINGNGEEKVCKVTKVLGESPSPNGQPGSVLGVDPLQRARETQTPPVYLLIVRPEGPGAPSELRLRLGLKILLRVCGLRAMEHRELSGLGMDAAKALAKQIFLIVTKYATKKTCEQIAMDTASVAGQSIPEIEATTP
jgi:hypothetical protein